eukprot:scaffold98176_cov34-Tisochrysis_lutea.AAC.4
MNTPSRSHGMTHTRVVVRSSTKKKPFNVLATRHARGLAFLTSSHALTPFTSLHPALRRLPSCATYGPGLWG